MNAMRNLLSAAFLLAAAASATAQPVGPGTSAFQSQPQDPRAVLLTGAAGIVSHGLTRSDRRGARVPGSTSASTTRAPARQAATNVAKLVFAGTITGRPRTPSASKVNSSAVVPDATAMAWRAPMYRADLMAHLRANPPRWIGIDTPWLTAQQSAEFQELRQFIGEQYTLANDPKNPAQGGWEVYRHQD